MTILLIEGLKHNQLSISQLCDNGSCVFFNKNECTVKHGNDSLLFIAKRQGNLYKIKLGELTDQNVSCLVSTKENSWMWHKKLGRACDTLYPYNYN